MALPLVGIGSVHHYVGNRTVTCSEQELTRTGTGRLLARPELKNSVPPPTPRILLHRNSSYIRRYTYCKSHGVLPLNVAMHNYINIFTIPKTYKYHIQYSLFMVVWFLPPQYRGFAN